MPGAGTAPRAQTPDRQEDRDVALVAGLRGRAASIPPAVWLGVIIAVSTANLVSVGQRVAGPWILPDELVYVELARSAAEGGNLSVRDAGSLGFSFVYSILIAPAYALTANLVAGYELAKALNAVLFSLAAAPAYALARRLLSPGLSLLSAALAVAVPSSTYATVVMTENAFYPVFLLFALSLVSMLERPTATRQLLTIATVALAFFTRAQAIVLLPAVVTAILVVAALEARAVPPRRSSAAARMLARFWPTWLTLTAGAAVVVAVQAARGQRFIDFLGPYSAAAKSYSPIETARWFLYHVADLDLYLGVLPLAALPLVALVPVAGAARSRLRIFLVTTAALTTWLLVLAAATAAEVPAGHTDVPPRIHERYVFYVAPLFVTLTLAWVAGGMPRPRKRAVAAAVTAAVLPVAIPFGELGHVASESPALIAWTLGLINDANAWVLVYTAILATVFLALPRRLALVVPLLVGVNFFVLRSFAVANSEMTSRDVLAASLTTDRDWIDEAVGSGGEVAVLWIGRSSDATSDHVGPGSARTFRRHRRVWLNEFFNERLGRVYYVGIPMLYGLPSQPLTRARDGTLRDEAGRHVRTPYVLAEAASGVVGREIARDEGTSMVLYRPVGALRLSQPARAR